MLAFLAFGLSAWQAAPVPLTDFLVYGPFPSGGRTPCPTDPVAKTIVDGTWKAPSEGQELSGRKWSVARAKSDGWLEGRALQGGYAFASYVSDRQRTMVLDAAGHSMVYVNGTPVGGDVYATGYVQMPVALKKGVNSFLFAVGRGRLRAALKELAATVEVTDLDPTFPDLLVGREESLPGSVLVRNASGQRIVGRIKATVDGKDGEWSDFQMGEMTVRKAAFWLPRTKVGGPAVHKLTVTLSIEGRTGLLTREFPLEAKSPRSLYRRTFVSRIDGSVQYYAVQPALNADAKALVLSLHGASVEATGQAGAYGQKTWCNIVCPTNGRPYGFDWEDWGRITALESLEDARKLLDPDDDKIYLTGHSMGGHGTWSIGLLESDRFGAIAPCAGWCSFWSYAGGADWKDPDPVEAMLRRAANASDTLKCIGNAEGLGIFVQHGDADDNVPVSEARNMRKALEGVKCDLDWHEEPGQGHWFDTDPEPGANCEDYRPLFDFLSRHRVPKGLERRTVSLTALSTQLGARKGFVKILGQDQSLLPSRVQASVWPDGTKVVATTENVRVIEFSAPGLAEEPEVELDRQVLKGRRFSKTGTTWAPFNDAGGPVKSADRPGGFKSAFDHGFRLVYLSNGPKADTLAAREKARFDAETWWYRGNGSATAIPDRGLADPLPAGNFVFYGTFECLGSRKALFECDGLKLGKDGVTIGSKAFKGDLGLLLVRPNPAGGTVALVGGTTLKGFRNLGRLNTFLAGVHYGDFFLASPEMLASGSKGVLATGFFDHEWKLSPQDWASR